MYKKKILEFFFIYDCFLKESNMLGNKGPRKMKVFTPEVQSNE